jgi:protein required for attachment to host cells
MIEMLATGPTPSPICVYGICLTWVAVAVGAVLLLGAVVGTTKWLVKSPRQQVAEEEKERKERAERRSRRTERKPNPARVTPDLFARQQALYEALNSFDEQNPPSEGPSLSSLDVDIARRRKEVYRRFLSPDENQQWDEAHRTAQAMAREAMRKAMDAADDAGTGRNDAPDTYVVVYESEMAARAPQIIRFMFE